MTDERLGLLNEEISISIAMQWTSQIKVAQSEQAWLFLHISMELWMGGEHRIGRWVNTLTRSVEFYSRALLGASMGWSAFFFFLIFFFLQYEHFWIGNL